jgi:hypothetical protein
MYEAYFQFTNDGQYLTIIDVIILNMCLSGANISFP